MMRKIAPYVTGRQAHSPQEALSADATDKNTGIAPVFYKKVVLKLLHAVAHT
ncbi:hypothetical protein [Rheinheimera sediminis]|uniref:hypothetical protein n=1 Tax=Rheinheimera sp. YQF-1 TaxID=2499626 RepID=UPI001646D7BC|nr:hypothetical protein [Rheinheimera sp. YQF-1]